MKDAPAKHYRLAGVPHTDARYVGALEAASQALRRGLLVAFPTETVYGLGAVIGNDDALREIFRVKGRPTDNPLIVHVADEGAAQKVCAQWPPLAQRAARAFWPGPLTLVLPRAAGVSKLVTAGRDTVAVRVPAQRVAFDLVASVGPVAAPSANRSGFPSPTHADHVLADLGDLIAMVLDDGPCPVGLESTVIDLTASRPIILRPGGLSKELLEEVLGEVQFLESPPQADPLSSAHTVNTLGARSPGTRYRHYSPSTPLLVINEHDSARLEAKLTQRVRSLRAQGKRVGVLAADDFAGQMLADAHVSLGSFDRPEDAAVRLFAGLRQLDQANVDILIAHTYPPFGVGIALNDRLLRASAAAGGGDAMRLLFVCTGNTCRSPMASTIMLRLAAQAGLTVEVRSAGIAAADGVPIAPEAARVLAGRGLDSASHQSQSIRVEDVEWADVVLTMTNDHKQRLSEMFPAEFASGKVYTLAEYANQDADISDPFGRGIESYEACAANLEHYLQNIIHRWKQPGS